MHVRTLRDPCSANYPHPQMGYLDIKVHLSLETVAPEPLRLQHSLRSVRHRGPRLPAQIPAHWTKGAPEATLCPTLFDSKMHVRTLRDPCSANYPHPQNGYLDIKVHFVCPFGTSTALSKCPLRYTAEMCFLDLRDKTKYPTHIPIRVRARMPKKVAGVDVATMCADLPACSHLDEQEPQKRCSAVTHTHHPVCYAMPLCQ